MKYLYLIFIIFISCRVRHSVDSTTKVSPDTSLITQSNNLIIDSTIGVIMYSDSKKIFDFKYVIDTNSVNDYSIVNLFDSKSISKLNPFAYNPDYYLLVFKCKNQFTNYYEIEILNDKSIFIFKQNTILKFETWDKHILNCFSIGLRNGSKLYSGPSLTSPEVFSNSDDFYFPQEINGEWLKVKFGDENDYKYAWVKWRDDKNLLIDLFYFS